MNIMLNNCHANMPNMKDNVCHIKYVGYDLICISKHVCVKMIWFAKD